MIKAQIDSDATKTSYLIIVIERDNLLRMEQADPITLETSTNPGGLLSPIRYPNNFHVLIAYEHKSGPLYEMVKAGKTGALLQYLMRGYKFKSVDGKKATPISGEDV